MLPKVGVGVLVLDRGKILLAKRSASHGVGTWSAPGGHLEHGETVVDCALRELYEETGLKGENVTLGPWREVFFKEADKHYLNLYAFVTKFSGTLVNREPDKAEEWRWFETCDLPTPLFPSLKKIALNQSLDLFIQEHLLKNPTVGYLSAPYNHPDEAVRNERYALISQKCNDLIKEGTFVFSPITHNIPIRQLGELTNWDHWGPYDLTMLALCKKMFLYQLPGWEESKGVAAEVAFAEANNIPIVEMKAPSMV